MEPLTLEKVQAFNQQLKKLVSSGLPFAPALQQRTHGHSDPLKQIENQLVIAANDGTGIDATLDDERRIPKGYAASLRLWVDSGGAPLAFEPLFLDAVDTARRRNQIRASMVQPVVWISVASLVLVIVCWGLSPNFENLSNQLHREPGFIVSLVSVLAGWRVIVIPVLVVISLFVFRWLSVAAARTTRSSMWCEMMHRSSLVDCALRLLDSEQRGEWMADDIGGHLEFGTQPSSQIQARNKLSALICRAHNAGEDDTESITKNPRATLLLTSRFYESMGRLSSATTLVLSRSMILVGGVLVLLVALSVFLPVIELLMAAANANGARP